MSRPKDTPLQGGAQMRFMTSQGTGQVKRGVQTQRWT